MVLFIFKNAEGAVIGVDTTVYDDPYGYYNTDFYRHLQIKGQGASVYYEAFLIKEHETASGSFAV